MSRHTKPYIKCEKKDGHYLLTCMKGGPGPHTLGGRGTAPLGDEVALRSKVIEMITNIRETGRHLEIQADGND